MPARRRADTLLGIVYAGLAAAPALLAIVLALGALTGGAGAATRRPAPSPPASASRLHSFDEPRAYALIRRILSFGPRPAGSAAERRVADYLLPLLPHAHFEAVPGGLRNIVGSLPGTLPAIVLSAHYDSTPVPGYLGANNSAAGMAAVVEIARDMSHDPRVPGQPAMRFVLFDGEEAPAGFSDFLAQALRGSRAYVQAHGNETREMILLDFIALYGESLPRDLGSDPTLWARLVAAATSVGEGSYFPPQTYEQIYDDDTPFNMDGIPAIDLIDFNYPCWQKDCDNLSQVSQTSLGAIGKTVLALMRAERARFTSG